MPELTFVIPIGPYHADVAQRAVDSVLSQTIPCNVVTIEDAAGRGAGFARNQGLRKVNSEFISFLDADDTLDPRFAETCFDILSRVQGNRYAYTNWYEGIDIRQAPSPCDLWTQQTYHIVTTVMHTDSVRRIGGYDEHMPGAEDTDFGIRLKLSGVCGVHVNAPLVHYNKGGQRSIDLRASGQEVAMLAYMKLRYGEITMGCCGDNTPNNNTPQGERADGDVLAQALNVGNRRTRGLATGRVYPYAGKPDIVYVDPRDVAAAPHQWQKVSAMPTNTPPVLQPGYQPNTVNWKDAAHSAFGGGQQHAQPAQPSQDWQYNPVENTRTGNDVLKIARRKTK